MPKPMLSIPLVNGAADDPGGWEWVFDRALAAERAGIDRLAVSDHVVFGENLEAYAAGVTDFRSNPLGTTSIDEAVHALGEYTQAFRTTVDRP